MPTSGPRSSSTSSSPIGEVWVSDLTGQRLPPSPRCRAGSACRRTRFARTRRRRPRAPPRGSSPRPVTLRIRPPFVTSRPSRIAVPAWKTSAPVGLCVLDALDRRARVAALGIRLCGESDGDGGGLGDAQLDVAEVAGGGAAERLGQVALHPRQDRLRLGVAEAAVELEHARPASRSASGRRRAAR